MKKPKLPENLYYWLDVIKDPQKVKNFIKRGSPKARQNLLKILKYDKWKKIQDKKEEKMDI